MLFYNFALYNKQALNDYEIAKANYYFASGVDYDKILIETMIAFKRAGADIIISYHAKEVAKLLNKE